MGTGGHFLDAVYGYVGGQELVELVVEIGWDWGGGVEMRYHHAGVYSCIGAACTCDLYGLAKESGK